MGGEAAWTIHVARGRITLSIRVDGEVSEAVRRALAVAFDAIQDLAEALDDE